MAAVHKVEIVNIKTRTVEVTLDRVEWDRIRDIIETLAPTEAVTITPRLEEV